MRIHPLFFAILTPSAAHANGQTTHLWITDTAIAHVENESLAQLLTEQSNSLRVGTMFPDGGYAIGHEYAEVAHWEPFQDRFRDWILDNYDDLSSPEAAPHVAFYFGLASHGMADQVFDSMYMERSRIYDAEYGWSESAESLDTSQDVVFADLTDPQTVPTMDIPSVLPELFADAGVAVDMATLEDGQGWLEIAVDGVTGMSEVSTLVDGHTESFPWGCTHLLDEDVPGAPPFEARVVAKYWESLWADLHGETPPLLVIGAWPEPRAERFPHEAGDVEARVSLIFNRGLHEETVSAERFTAESSSAPVGLQLDLFYGDDSHVVNIAPSDGWLTDSIHTVAVDGAVGTDGRAQDERFALEFNTGQYAEPGSKETTNGCDCSHANGPRWGWLWLLPLLAFRRR